MIDNKQQSIIGCSCSECWNSYATTVLSLIAAPQRPDGTWNRDRQACQELATEALRRMGYSA